MDQAATAGGEISGWDVRLYGNVLTNSH